jgi:hypothetical protein
MQSFVIGSSIGAFIGLMLPIAGAAKPGDDCNRHAWPYFPPECLISEEGAVMPEPRLAVIGSPSDHQLQPGHLAPLVRTKKSSPAIAPSKSPSFENPIYFDAVPEGSARVTVWRNGVRTTYLVKG